MGRRMDDGSRQAARAEDGVPDGRKHRPAQPRCARGVETPACTGRRTAGWRGRAVVNRSRMHSFPALIGEKIAYIGPVDGRQMQAPVRKLRPGKDIKRRRRTCEVGCEWAQRGVRSPRGGVARVRRVAGDGRGERSVGLRRSGPDLAGHLPRQGLLGVLRRRPGTLLHGLLHLPALSVIPGGPDGGPVCHGSAVHVCPPPSIPPGRRAGRQPSARAWPVIRRSRPTWPPWYHSWPSRKISESPIVPLPDGAANAASSADDTAPRSWW
jgi:hypothetical protein